MIDIDITMPIQIINILILIVIMNILLYKPIRGVLSEREKKIGGLKNDIETLHKNARLRLEEIEKKMRDARAKAKAEVEAVRNVAVKDQGIKLATLRESIEKDKKTQLAQIGTQFAAAQKQLQSQVDVFAKEMAGKMLGREL